MYASSLLGPFQLISCLFIHQSSPCWFSIHHLPARMNFSDAFLLLLCLLAGAELDIYSEQRREMTSVWKTKVLPGLNKIFDKDGKKAAAVGFLKSFNKEEIGKEIEDKKTELEPKVVETYEASPPEVKALFKDKKPVKISKKNSAAVTKFLDELAKIDFPGAKVVSEAVAKSGTTPLSPAITFILDKVAPFIPEEPKAEPAAAEATSREVAVEEKKEEAEPAAAAATEEAAPAPAETPSEPAAEEKKEEEKPAAEEAAPPAAAPEEK